MGTRTLIGTCASVEIKCWICGRPIVQAATYRLNVVSKQTEGRVRGGRPQEKVSWPSTLMANTSHIAPNCHRPRKGGDEEDEFNQDEDDEFEGENS